MIQAEVSSLVAEVDRIASSAQFNGYNMLTGRFTTGGADEMVFAYRWVLTWTRQFM